MMVGTRGGGKNPADAARVARGLPHSRYAIDRVTPAAPVHAGSAILDAEQPRRFSGRYREGA
jgi:hypothetical protein